jgi:hypothetical protein
MNMTRDRLQSIGWFTLLAICAVLTGSLVLRVNAVKSQVQISQRQIMALKRENEFLETEYETRANQQQLAMINDLNFGYKAPEAGQYLDSERQLAMLGKPRSVDAPAPIEVASADDPKPASLGNLVPNLASRLVTPAMAEVPAASRRGAHGLTAATLNARTLNERLARIDPPDHRE